MGWYVDFLSLEQRQAKNVMQIDQNNMFFNEHFELRI